MIARRLEALNDAEFVYTRVVPERMIEGNPPVKIWVVHNPYHGPLRFHFAAKP